MAIILSMKTESNPSGQTIIFDEDVHTFTLQGKNISGVTSFISSFFDKFDSEYWSERKANERNVSKETILEEWAAKSNRGIKEGNNLHAYAEYLILTQFLGQEEICPKPISKRCGNLFQTVELAIEWLTSFYTPVAIEKIIFSEKIRLAGIIDAIFENDEAVCIVDWKQNKEIKKFNPYQSGKGPLKHLEEHDFNKYSLQLNSYRRILMEEEYFPGKEIRMMLLHITPESYYPMHVRPMDKEIQGMLDQKDSLFPNFI